MAGSDPARFDPCPADVIEALRLLTRLPLPDSTNAPRGGRAAWAWPVAGLCVGAVAAIAGVIAFWAGTGPGIAAAVTLGAQGLVTGALHEDGLADTFDGLWGGHDRDRRLAIMKDSRIGTYGVLALLIVTLLRWSALTTAFGAGGPTAAILSVAMLSRVPMIGVMAALPNARGSGISDLVGRPGRAELLAGTALALLAGAMLAGWAVVPMALAGAAVAVTLALIARAKIGGQTGDILGASQQLAEAAMLAAFVAAV